MTVPLHRLCSTLSRRSRVSNREVWGLHMQARATVNDVIISRLESPSGKPTTQTNAGLACYTSELHRANGQHRSLT